MSRLPADLDVALRELATRRPLLVASDYDGVLAPLVGDPAAAAPDPGVAAALSRLTAVHGVTVAMVSGRGVRDLQATSGFTGDLRWVGSHGAELDGPLTGELADQRNGPWKPLVVRRSATPRPLTSATVTCGTAASRPRTSATPGSGSAADGSSTRGARTPS